ncbi:transglycosylase SLT domain-containing protein [Terriglobus sp. RCC_193]|uniref:lytic transglycosylase domain-containing protein n=1 Tax=Terriglobus sp. RCC_193 TaxID=3239218 RepID=UPI0035251BC4
MLAGTVGAVAQKKKATHTTASSTHSTAKSSSTAKTAKSKSTTTHGKSSKAAATHALKKGTHAKTTRMVSEPTVQSKTLHTAFVESSTLRPMAQQLAAGRSSAAFAGVQSYASAHPGEGAAAAYLAMGHAYAVDRRYGDAVSAYKQASTQGSALRDYADYLAAQAALNNHDASTAITLLTNFAQKYPASIFVPSTPVTLANAYLLNNDANSALRTLAILMGQSKSQSADYLITEAKAHQMAGDVAAAVSIYRQIFVRLPFSPEAQQSRVALQSLNAGPTAGERKLHADALFNAKRYGEAGAEYDAIKNDASLSQADRDALDIYGAVCDLKLKHLSRRDAEKLPDTGDDSAALKLYILAEISRNEGDTAGHTSILQQMEQRFPKSRWLEEALYSGGNMYLIKRDSTQAIAHYGKLFEMFPNSTYAPSVHWRSAWLNYRLRNYSEAARLMEEQIMRFPLGPEVPTALYWRGRLYRDVEKNSGQAANYFSVLSNTYRNYYYANLARQQLQQMGTQTQAAPADALGYVKTPPAPTLVAALPENDPHLIKARLLANAALNEYIGPEIQASGTASQWGALAEAEIYSSYGENVRALQAVKRSGSGLYTLPVSEVPSAYWTLLFPRPYWGDLTTNAEAQGLDPYLVASLIRQESEFNPGAISRANAMGLMQLLPGVGKQEAKRAGMKKFTAPMLLNPSINLKLGTMNLREVLGRWNNTPEYALAAYNAGDVPVRNWVGEGNYKDLPEFVESIPYTETREYVQSILRNREMYRQLYR